MKSLEQNIDEINKVQNFKAETYSPNSNRLMKIFWSMYKTTITLILLLSSRGKVALCAWTGIASILLKNSVTVHNLFKLPVPLLDTQTCWTHEPVTSRLMLSIQI